jgi:hypothetical protein
LKARSDGVIRSESVAIDLRFDSSGGTGIHGGHSSVGIAKKEGEIDGQRHGFPLEIGKCLRIHSANSAGDAEKLCAFLAAKDDRTSIARASDLARLSVEQMLVDFIECSAAQLAALHLRPRLRKTAEC